MDGLVSIIIPVFNSARSVPDCLASIVAQTYRNFEILLIDDGSRDDSWKVCKKWSMEDSRIRAHRQDNRGPASARNRGLLLAEGEYIAFIDCDDLVAPDYLESLLSLLNSQNADVAAVSYKIVARDEAKKRIGKMSRTGAKKNPAWVGECRTFDAQSALFDMLYQKKLDSACWGKIFRRSAIGNKRFPEQFRVFEDMAFVYDVYKDCRKIVWIDKIKYFYIKNFIGQMDSVAPTCDDAIEAVLSIRDDISARGETTLIAAAESRALSICFNGLKLLAQAGFRNFGLETRYWGYIVEHRRAQFLDPHVRLKNKLGIILSLFGLSTFKSVCRRRSDY